MHALIAEFVAASALISAFTVAVATSVVQSLVEIITAAIEVGFFPSPAPPAAPSKMAYSAPIVQQKAIKEGTEKAKLVVFDVDRMPDLISLTSDNTPLGVLFN